MNLEEQLEQINIQVSRMTPEKLEKWGKSQECYDYLHR